MSFYRRFFSYIFAYEQNQKTSSAGFAKIEIRDQATRLELHMRTSSPLEHVRLYLFVREDDFIQGFPLGDVALTDGCANRRFTMEQARLGDSDYEIWDVAGILLTCEDQICFVSQWDEAPVDWESFRIYEKPEEVKEAEGEEEINEADTKEEAAATEKAVELQTEELPIPEPAVLNAAPEKAAAWPKIWEQLLSTQPLMQPFSDENIRCARIELKDLRLLPASNWHLCNNSFLLRGFFTYRHLLIGEVPGRRRWFVGVPGIRYRQEHVMAAIFGFSDFLPEKDSAEADAPFGYWCVSISESD